MRQRSLSEGIIWHTGKNQVFKLITPQAHAASGDSRADVRPRLLRRWWRHCREGYPVFKRNHVRSVRNSGSLWLVTALVVLFQAWFIAPRWSGPKTKKKTLLEMHWRNVWRPSRVVLWWGKHIKKSKELNRNIQKKHPGGGEYSTCKIPGKKIKFGILALNWTTIIITCSKF